MIASSSLIGMNVPKRTDSNESMVSITDTQFHSTYESAHTREVLFKN